VIILKQKPIEYYLINVARIYSLTAFVITSLFIQNLVIKSLVIKSVVFLSFIYSVNASAALTAKTLACHGQNASIAQLQGAGRSSPYTNPRLKQYRSKQIFTVRGVVTVITRNIERGFFMQQTEQPANSLASTGIFVAIKNMPAGLKPGMSVCVTAHVEEDYGMTQLLPTADIQLLGLTEAVHPTALLLVASDTDFRVTLERYEGMLIKLVGVSDMRVSKPFAYDRRSYGYSMILTHRQVNIHPNSRSFPGSIMANQHALENKQRRLYLQSDEREKQGEVPYYPDFAKPKNKGVTTDYIRVNDRVVGAEGVVRFSYGEFRLIVGNKLSAANFIHLADRSDLPLLKRGDLRIASFNVLNYFNSNFGGGRNPLGNNALRHRRGAKTKAEFALQEAKLSATIIALDADFIGLMEVENNGYGQHSAIQRLVRLVNSKLTDASKRYRVVVPDRKDLHEGRYLGSGAISVAALYRPSQLTLSRTHVIALPVQRSASGNAYHRQALTPTFTRLADGLREGKHPPLTISVNHFKSKGSACLEDRLRVAKFKQQTKQKGKQRDRKKVKQDRQGNCAAFRVDAARVLGEALAVQTGDKIILGDLNSYPKEDPLLVLTDYDSAAYSYYKIVGGQRSYLNRKRLDDQQVNYQRVDSQIRAGFGYVNPFADDLMNSWSYSFQALGSLDYILLSPGLVPRLVDKTVWHINAAESPLLEYSRQHTGAMNKFTDPFRSSDHDPVLIELK
jgi:predicted extracellular nuclease